MAAAAKIIAQPFPANGNSKSPYRNLQAMVTLPSLLDNDFYKFTMQQCVVKLFPKAKARYKFINRGGHRFPPGFAEAVKASVNAMTGLKLSTE